MGPDPISDIHTSILIEDHNHTYKLSIQFHIFFYVNKYRTWSGFFLGLLKYKSSFGTYTPILRSRVKTPTQV